MNAKCQCLFHQFGPLSFGGAGGREGPAADEFGTIGIGVGFGGAAEVVGLAVFCGIAPWP